MAEPRKRGAPFGERNGRYKTGRYSRPKIAERMAAFREDLEKRRQWFRENEKKIDYSGICDAIRETALDGATIESTKDGAD